MNDNNEHAIQMFKRSLTQKQGNLRERRKNTMMPLPTTNLQREHRYIERELASRVDETEENMRPRTPPNIKADHQADDMFLNSDDRMTE